MTYDHWHPACVVYGVFARCHRNRCRSCGQRAWAYAGLYWVAVFPWDKSTWRVFAWLVCRRCGHRVEDLYEPELSSPPPRCPPEWPI